MIEARSEGRGSEVDVPGVTVSGVGSDDKRA